LSRACLTDLEVGISRHSQRLPYYVLEVQPGAIPNVLRNLHLPIEVLCLVRHWCRLRCGLVALRRRQSCIFCPASTAHPLVHCMALCPRWATIRHDFLEVEPGRPCETNQQLAVRILGSSLSKQGLCMVVKWAAMIDDEAFQFWHE